MRGATTRRILILDTDQQRHRLRALQPATLTADTGYGHLVLGGEPLCQLLLQEDPEAMVVARGPLPYLSGNKTTVGYVSPLTGLPHYSFVGGRGFAELLNLGLDAVVLSGSGQPGSYVAISGRAPHLSVEWKPAAELPSGQRSAYHWLLDRELAGHPDRGSIFAVGEGARLGYRTANLGVDGLYHAGRGGAGRIFRRFAAAMVLMGDPCTVSEWFGARLDPFLELRDGEIRQRLDLFCNRLSRRDGGTVTKLHKTGSGRQPTLPAHNAQCLGYAAADLGAGAILRARRVGQTGCHWCQVNCRHWHWVDADYASGGRDRLLDDFEPTYAVFAMLDLRPDQDSLDARLRLLDAVDQRVILPIEEMGCDVIDIGVGLAGLFEGLERGLLPLEDVPGFLRHGPRLGNLDLVAQTVAALRAGDPSPALQAVGDGPQALAQRYPAMQDILFTSGPGTLANPGHANALWTFLMPFSRYFSHYAAQLYKMEGDLPSGTSPSEIETVFEQVVSEALQREALGCLGNALSACAFTFAIFSQDGRGQALDDSELLVRTLACYGIETARVELEWFAEAFWAQSIALKLELGWQPPSAASLPARVFEALSLALGRPVSELRALMDQLIAEWKRQAADRLYTYGVGVPPDW